MGKKEEKNYHLLYGMHYFLSISMVSTILIIVSMLSPISIYYRQHRISISAFVSMLYTNVSEITCNDRFSLLFPLPDPISIAQ